MTTVNLTVREGHGNEFVFQSIRSVSVFEKEESTFEEIERAIRLFSRKLPAYEYLIRKYMTDEYCRAVVVRSDGIEEPHYRIIGYDAERRSVFLQAKTGLYGSTKNQEVKHLDIEEFIFGLYLIWNVIDPVEQYTSRSMKVQMKNFRSNER